MKRLAALSLAIALVSGSIQARGQELLDRSPVLYAGPPVLTQAAADCALGLIKLQAAVASGVDAIEITAETRQIWRNYLAANYPNLLPGYQYQFGPLACMALGNFSSIMTQASALERETYRQQWIATLPPVLEFLDPVLRAASVARAANQRMRALEQLRAARQSAPPAVQSPDPAAAWRRQQEMANSLAAFNGRMNNIYVPNLMRAMSGR
jgi:hypothetical protein